MALEPIAPGVASDGNGLLLFVPAGGIANPAAPTIAELTAAIVKRLTYSLIPGGFNHQTTENANTTGRYTAKQKVEQPGTVSDSVELTYVYTATADDIARLVLETGIEGFLVHRTGVANQEPIAAGQLVTVIPGSAGLQRGVPATENTDWQIIQKWWVSGNVERFVPVVAGS